MNAELRQSFARLKPVCDVVMIRPSEDSVRKFLAKVAELRREIVQELQQYLLFPFITHLKSTEMERKYETQWLLVDGMREVLERVSVNSFEMCLKIETTLLQLIFDNSKPGMIAEVPEELKHSVMKCLTALMINIEKKYREKLLKTQVPLLAQAIFVSVHIAKLEKLRALRLQALYCVMAHTATHPQLTTDKYRIADAGLENKVVDMLASILPGVLAALQDVATCTNNPGHAIVVAAIEAIHRILCLVMQDKYLKKRETVTAQDFLRMFPQHVKHDEAHCKEAIKDVEKRSCEWYSMAGGKLTIITKSLLPLRTHEHFKVRRELAVYSARILNECTLTMQPSMNVVLDILISLSKDEYPVVSQYCLEAVSGYFENAPPETRHRTMDNLSENLFVMLNGLPRVLNNIDNNRKLYALNLLHGYLHMMCDDGRPQRLTLALSPHNNMRRLCAALLAASAPRPPALLAHHSRAELTTPLLPESPWSKLQHLDPGPCSARLEDILALLGGAECAELVLDRLLQLLHQERCPNVLYAINHMARGAGSTRRFIERALDAYIAEDVWYLPLEVAAAEPPLTKYDTKDPAVYNPRAWTRDSVPGLYEGTVETRYTDVGYSAPRPPPRLQPNVAASLAHAQRNVVMSCLLTEGLGFMAQRLGADFQPYLLKTLCLVLERVGSKYSLIHLAGLGALQRVALAGGHASVSALVAHNADYFTHQVTLRLKKSWDSESALQILSVVMEYSDPSVLDCLYGIVKDVLVQSCDKYYEKNLYSYLQVFLTFVNCLHKWFPVEDQVKTDGGTARAQLDITKELLEFIDDIEKTERLMNDDEFEEETGKTVEEMYREDLKRKEDDILDYDDKVTDEKPPLPQHIVVTLSILRRCVHFVGATAREPALLALRLLARGLPLLRGHEDELLPLVHQAWAPLVPRFNTDEPVVLRRALDLLVVMAEMSKDFIHGRCVKEVLPNLYEYLHKSAADSHLKDAGSYYRSSAAYVLQLAVLEALPTLALQLRLRDNDLEAAMACVDYYLSNKQPRPLQAAAVKFFKDILEYDHGAAWYHLRTACDNTRVLAPPPLAVLPLEPVVGTPYEPSLGEREANIVAIFSPTPT